MTSFGNYHAYQGGWRHSPDSGLPAQHVQDPRLAKLETMIPGLFASKECLDIGCNAGTISVQLALNSRAASVTGIDHDEDLIKKADRHLVLRSSRVRPATDGKEPVPDYFPITAVRKQTRRRPRPSDWPYVKFISEDWVVSENPATEGPFDVILALSIIKWIHLQHLDTGLDRFLRKCCSCLKPGGYLVIEVHPWKSYEQAVKTKKAPHYADNFEKLAYRTDTDLPALLKPLGLDLCATSEELPRRLDVYQKNRLSHDEVLGE